MREKREQENENSEAPQRNRKKKSDTPEGKSDTHKRESDTHERKFNYFAEASEVRKVLPTHEPLNLQYCKDSKIWVPSKNSVTYIKRSAP